MCDFISISGWVFGVISLVFGVISLGIAIYQLLEKKKYQKQVNTIKQKNEKGNNYQSSNDMTVNQ